MKKEWKSGYTKTQTTDSVQKFSFFSIDRTFSTEKIGFFFLSLQKDFGFFV